MQTPQFQELNRRAGGVWVRWNGRPGDVKEGRLGERRVEERGRRGMVEGVGVVLEQGEAVIGKIQ